MIIKEITAAGKDILEAKENARVALGAGELDDVQFEIIDAGTRGFFGFMSRPAKVRAFIEGPDAPEKPKRHEKPARDKSPRPERAEGQPAQKKRKNKPEKRGDKPERQDKPQAPKSEVIPEAELKMERREIGEGEDMSYDFVRTVISDIGLSASAELYACEDGTRRITIVGDDASVLIGHHGETLDALQYLANLASAKKNSKGERDKSRVTLDIEGYRKKREETLRALARRMAAKAQRNRRSVMLEPMSAYERRIIHSEIQGIDGVSTNSIGSDNNRKIVIFLTDKKPRGIFEEEKKTPLSEEFAPDEANEITDPIVANEICMSEGEESESTAIEELRPADEIVGSDDELK
ncbi:MAG: Jag N-terminal domain-containing protein [Clostridia bacterium]|nr:Jag N-terminal domain-containing protein [Clostridia bacterium]